MLAGVDRQRWRSLLWSRDPQAYWERVLNDLAARARSAGLDVGPADLVPGAAQMMTGMMSASAVASSPGALFLGSWWAGTKTGGVSALEFQGLAHGPGARSHGRARRHHVPDGLRSTLDDLLLVLGTGFVVQGLAVIHWHGARREWPKAVASGALPAPGSAARSWR